MGYYINPKNQTKEQWLEENKVQASRYAPTFIDFRKADESDMCFVCLVENGHFSAAAIGYCENEINVFNDPNDYRPKKWFMVSKEKIREIEPSVDGIGIFQSH